MYLKCIPSGPLATNAYLIGCKKTKKVVVIDPSEESGDVLINLALENNFTIEAIWLTHSHWDHIADVAYLKRVLSIPVYLHKNDAPNLKNPGADRLPLFIPIDPVEPDGFFKDSDNLSVGDLQASVIHTPGHSPGGCCFYFEKQHTLISGDTLFKGSMGKVSFYTSNPKDMWASLKKLATLPGKTIVYPGHGPSTTIGAESWMTEAEDLFG